MSDGLAVRSTASYLLKKVPVVRPDAITHKSPHVPRASLHHSFEEVDDKPTDLLNTVFPVQTGKDDGPAELPPSRTFAWDDAKPLTTLDAPTKHGQDGERGGLKYGDWGDASPPWFATFDPTKVRYRDPYQDDLEHHDSQQFPSRPYNVPTGYAAQALGPYSPPMAPRSTASPLAHYLSPLSQPVALPAAPYASPLAHLSRARSEAVPYANGPVESTLPRTPPPGYEEQKPLDVNEVANVLRAANVLPRRPRQYRQQEYPRHQELPHSRPQRQPQHQSQQNVHQHPRPRRYLHPESAVDRPQGTTPTRDKANQIVGVGDPSPVEPLVAASLPPTPSVQPAQPTPVYPAPAQPPPEAYRPPAPNVTSPVKFDVKQRFSDTERLYIDTLDRRRFPAESTLPLTEHRHLIKPVERMVLLRGDGKVGVTFNETPDGVFITGLVPGGNAEKAGVPERGRVVSINGKQIRGTDDLVLAKSSSSVQALVVVDVGVTEPRARKLNLDDGIGREVTAISDPDRLIRCVQAHPGLSCSTEDDIASYLAVRGCRGIVTDQDLEDATVLVNFPGPELQAWLPLTAVIEYKLRPASEKLPSVAGQRDYSMSPNSDVESVTYRPPRKVEVKDPDIAAAGLPLVHPEDDVSPSDPATDLKVVLAKYPEDRYFVKPVALRDYSPERGEQTMLARIDALQVRHEGDDDSEDYVPALQSVREAGEGPQAFFQYGFDPRGDGIYLKDNSPDDKRRYQGVDGLVPSTDDDPRRENYLFPPPHYPAGMVDSDEEDNGTAHDRNPVPFMGLDPEDEEYLQKLEIFQDEMEEYYKKAGPDDYRAFVQKMLDDRTCPEELVGVYRKQMARMKIGKHPFKHRRRKPFDAQGPESNEEPKNDANGKKPGGGQHLTQEVNDDEYMQKLAEFEDQMDSYYKAAGKTAYKSHLENLFRTSQVPPELTEDYTEQLNLLKAGKDPTLSKRQQQRIDSQAGKKKEDGKDAKEKEKK